MTMAGKPQLNVASLKAQVEAALETLLREADGRVQWKPPGVSDAPTLSSYTCLPGVYRSTDLHDHTVQASVDHDCGAVTLVLHGDNTFEYSWEMHRPTPRAMEYCVKLVGTWHKPVLNRTRRGDDDQRVFLTTSKIQFQRFSNYDSESQTWKMTLHTLTRRGSDWAPVGESERGVPPINMVFHCTDDGSLESTGAIVPAQVMANSPACRVVAGLTKKVANKLGGPLDVMTEKWLPVKHLRLTAVPQTPTPAKNFNPFFCLAEALLRNKPTRSDPIDLEVHETAVVVA